MVNPDGVDRSGSRSGLMVNAARRKSIKRFDDWYERMHACAVCLLLNDLDTIKRSTTYLLMD